MSIDSILSNERLWHVETTDVLDGLRALPDGCVQCCVTSPPYYALRDYGIDGQIGLEETPDAYIAKMVEVFSEVRRVLRDDGTLFLNIGDSYYGGGGYSPDSPSNKSGSKQSTSGGSIKGRRSASAVSRRGALANGTACKALPNSTAPDSSCCDLCDECAAALSNHTARSGQLHLESCEPSGTIGRDTSRLDSSSAAVVVEPPAAPQSTTGESFSRPSELCSHCANCGACLLVLRSSSRDARLCGRKAWYMNGSDQHGSACRNQDTGALGLAYRYSTTTSLKSKDLLGIPWLLAFALRADGWYLRSEIIWHKPNPMPESVTDRPSKSHEQIFLLSKAQKYFYDAEAVREAQAEETADRYSHGFQTMNGKTGLADSLCAISVKQTLQKDGQERFRFNPSGRNKRSVWSIPLNGYREAHFATFPPALPETCLKAGTSLKGCCSVCGAPWQRVTESERVPTRPGDGSKVFGGTPNWSHVKGNRSEVLGDAKKLESEIVGNRDPERHVTQTVTTGWQPGCECNGELWPCVAIDPFNGAGTTGLVAAKGLGLRYVGFELNPEYADMARRRINRGFVEPTPKVQSAAGQQTLFGEPA